MDETKLFKREPSTFGTLQFCFSHAINTKVALTRINVRGINSTAWNLSL